MNILRSKSVCFTGHRPAKLPDGGARNSQKTKAIKSMIYYQIYEAVKDGYDTFITGMQRGVDLWAGEAVLDMMSISKTPLKLIAVLPYKGFGSGFTGEDKFVFGRILEAAGETVSMCDSYTHDCMLARDRFMVDNSARIIAVLSTGLESSGTGYTLRYAKSCGLEVRRIDPAATFVSPAGEDGQLSFDVTVYEGEPERPAGGRGVKVKYSRPAASAAVCPDGSKYDDSVLERVINSDCQLL